MHLFALIVGGLLGLALALFLLAGAVAIRLRVKRARFTTAIADLLMIVDSTVWHVGHQLRPKGKLSDVASTALKAEALVLVREMGASQIFEIVQGLRLPEAMVEPMLSGLIEKALASARSAPAETPTDGSDQPAEQ